MLERVRGLAEWAVRGARGGRSAIGKQPKQPGRPGRRVWGATSPDGKATGLERALGRVEIVGGGGSGGVFLLHRRVKLFAQFSGGKGGELA